MPEPAGGGEPAVAVDDHGVERAEVRVPLAAAVALIRAATDGDMPEATRERLHRFLAVRIRGS